MAAGSDTPPGTARATGRGGGRDPRARPGPAAGERSAGEVSFFTVAEVAGLMRVSKMTVYRLVHAGTLPAIRVGRSFRVPAQAVHDYLRDSYIEAG